MKSALLLPLSVLTLALQAATAAQPVEIEVTSSRSSQALGHSLASISVLTQADIQVSQAQTLPELLRGLPGVSIANNGGIGKASSLFLRGTNSDHLLVLIDGLAINSVSSGLAALQEIPLNQIERIELVRGPRSSLYGSEAIGGVLQIFTRKGSQELKPSAKFAVGSKGTAEVALGLTGGNQRGWFNLNAQGLRTDGFNACNFQTGCDVDESDPDGYHQHGFGLNSGLELDPLTSLELNLQKHKGYNEYDSGQDWQTGEYYANASRTEQQQVNAKLNMQPLSAWKLHLSAGQSQDNSAEIDTHDQAYRYDSYINGTRNTASFLNELTLTDSQQLNLGFDNTTESVDSTNAYSQPSRDNSGVFGLYQVELWQQQLQLSGRQDHSSQYGSHDTGAFAWGTEVADGLKVRASYGTAFKAPTLNDLYWPNSGNPNLQPEKSASSEVGIDGHSDWASWSVSLYQNRIEQLIAWAPAPTLANPFRWAPANINNAQINGLEFGFTTSFGGWDSKNQLSFMQPENRVEGANYGKLLIRRAARTAKLSLERSFSGQLVGIDWLAESHKYDDAANTKRIGGYGLLNLRTERAINSDWRWQFGIDNLLNQNYETARGYDQPGTTVKFALLYQP